MKEDERTSNEKLNLVWCCNENLYFEESFIKHSAMIHSYFTSFQFLTLLLQTLEGIKKKNTPNSTT